MNNTIDKYLHDFKKALKVEPTLRGKILSDIRYDLETKMSAGDTMEDILAKFGTPEELAQEFNLNYSEYNKIKQIRTIKACFMISFIVAMICFIIGVVGRSVCFNADNISHVGGVDLPTQVITTSNSISALNLFDLLIKTSIVVAVIALIAVGYFTVKTKKKG